MGLLTRDFEIADATVTTTEGEKVGTRRSRVALAAAKRTAVSRPSHTASLGIGT